MTLSVVLTSWGEGWEKVNYNYFLSPVTNGDTTLTSLLPVTGWQQSLCVTTELAESDQRVWWHCITWEFTQQLTNGSLSPLIFTFKKNLYYGPSVVKLPDTVGNHIDVILSAEKMPQVMIQLSSNSGCG